MLQSLDRKLLLLLILSMIGILTILYSTRWGTGLSEDSLMYIRGAEGMLNGRGYSYVAQTGESVSIANWPPMFSLALIPFGLAGMSIVEAVRWLNALLFGINILLIGYIIYRKTAFWPAIVSSILILTSDVMLEIHAWAWSEPLYISLGVSGLWFLDTYINESKSYPLILSALFIGAATLTRYVGVTLIATLCLSIIIFGKRPLRRKYVDCLIAGLISSLPLLLWLIRNLAVSGHTSSISSHFHLPTLRHILVGGYTISLWLLPQRTTPLFLRGLILAIAVGLLLLMIMRLRKRSLPSICFLNGMYLLVYCLFLAGSISFISLGIAFDLRYLSPVFVSVLIILACSIYRLSLEDGKKLRTAITALCLLVSLVYAHSAFSKVKRIRQVGLGFEGQLWKQSEIIDLVKKLPGNIRIYSSGALPINLLTHREIKYLPMKINAHTGEPAGDYLRTLEEIKITSQSQRTVIICTSLYTEPVFPSENELTQIFSLRKISSASDGSIYEIID